MGYLGQDMIRRSFLREGCALSDVFLDVVLGMIQDAGRMR